MKRQSCVVVGIIVYLHPPFPLSIVLPLSPMSLRGICKLTFNGKGLGLDTTQSVQLLISWKATLAAQHLPGASRRSGELGLHSTLVSPSPGHSASVPWKCV